jgi:hypothetical protein
MVALEASEWTRRVGVERSKDRPIVKAETYLMSWPSFSRPVALRCDDGRTYVVKGRQPDRPELPYALTNEQVVGRLGQYLGAPIPRLALVDVPEQLIASQPELSHLEPGLAHGSELVPNCSDRLPIGDPGSQRNREAYGRLAVLYGWTVAGDHQLVRTLDAAGDIYSVDHGHFFPGGPAWSADGLQAHAAPAAPDAQLAAYADPYAQADANARAKSMSRDQIAIALGFSHPSWQLTDDEVGAVGEFLDRQRVTL